MSNPERINVALPARWFPYALLPSDRNGNRPQPLLVEIGTANAWTIDVVVNALKDHALTWHRQADQWAKAQSRPTADEYRQWIAQTRALADRVPLTGATPVLMLQAADKLERALLSWDRYFPTWPAFGTQADANRRTSLHLWGIDYFLRAANEAEAADRDGQTEALDYPMTKVWPALFGPNPDDEPTDDEPSFCDYNNAQKRITTLEQSIAAGQHDALMVMLLRGVLSQE